MKNSQNTRLNNIWLQNISGNWRDIECPCGNSFHFDGHIEKLFDWEKIHIRHMASDYGNHSMISFYPDDMVIFYHSKTGYVVERRRHKSYELDEIKNAWVHGKIKVTGA
ncbi:MAG: hypothetical protein WCB31_13490 [Nitrososphaeraceae archaeon]